MRKITNTETDSDGSVLEEVNLFLMLSRLLNPTTEIALFADGDEMEPTETWEIVDVEDTLTVFEITALVDRRREVKIMIVLIGGVWHIDGAEGFSAIHFFPAEEETVGLRIDF